MYAIMFCNAGYALGMGRHSQMHVHTLSDVCPVSVHDAAWL